MGSRSGAVSQFAVDISSRDLEDFTLDGRVSKPHATWLSRGLGDRRTPADDPSVGEEDLGGRARPRRAEDLQPAQVDEYHRAVIQKNVDVPPLERRRKSGLG
jgi:hypothetical protein